MSKKVFWGFVLFLLTVISGIFVSNKNAFAIPTLGSDVYYWGQAYEGSNEWTVDFYAEPDPYVWWNGDVSSLVGAWERARAGGSPSERDAAGFRNLGQFNGTTTLANRSGPVILATKRVSFSSARRVEYDHYYIYEAEICFWYHNQWSKNPELQGWGDYCTNVDHTEWKKFTLRGIAIDTSGNLLNLADVTQTVEYADPGTITRRDPPTGYIFKGWRSNRYSGTPSGGASYRTTIYGDTTVYAVYEKKVTLTGSAYDTKGRKMSLSDVSNTVASGSTATVTRRGAPSGYVFKEWRSSVGSGRLTTNASYSERISGNKTVYAIYAKQVTLTGQACDTGGHRITSIANVTSRPVDEGSTASITRRTSDYYTFVGWSNSCGGGIISTGTSYSKTISNDTTIYAIYDKNKFEGYASIREVDSVNNKKESVGYTMDNAETDPMYIKCTNNNNGCNIELEFKINRKVGNGATKYSISTVPNSGNPSAVIETNGTSYGDKRNLRPNGNLKLTLGTDQCYLFDFLAVPADNKHAILKLCVVAPYNFENEVKIDSGLGDDESTVAPGEELKTSIEIEVKRRANSLVGSDDGYATEVPNASYGYEVRTENANGTGKKVIEEKSFNGTLNDGTDNARGISNFIRKTKNESGEDTPVIVPDVEMGTRLCIKAWISPANSGVESNTSISGFDTRQVVAEKCYVVAKKPLMEVLGSEMYAARDVLTSISEKHKIGEIEYKDNVHVFGSFAEHAVIGLGVITNFSSASVPGQVLGSIEDGSPNFCAYRTLLTIANYPCDSTENKSDTAGKSGVYADAGVREKVLAYWQNRGDAYERIDGNLDISSGTFANMPAVRFVHVTENATITGDLSISGSFSTISEIPKTIIYAEKDIKISCGVKRVDAILIAGKSVNTCGNNKDEPYDGMRAVTSTSEISERSELLTVNGTIISDELIPSRVGGAGTGESSNVPAEIINYDSSILLWEKALSLNNTKTTNLTTIYQKELAPRY